jgi:chaperonin cofactor prefoldin
MLEIPLCLLQYLYLIVQNEQEKVIAALRKIYRELQSLRLQVVLLAKNNRRLQKRVERITKGIDSRIERARIKMQLGKIL